MPQIEVVEQFEKALAEPLPEEVSADELERRRRRRIAEENRGATERLAGITQMDRSR